jgi:hypothetical protein
MSGNSTMPVPDTDIVLETGNMSLFLAAEPPKTMTYFPRLGAAAPSIAATGDGML